MKRIPLTKGQEALVDAQDYDYLMQWKWHCGTNGYACRSLKGGRSVLLHRAVFGRTHGYVSRRVDHCNLNPLDCRRRNLRSATQSQNMAHRGLDRNNTSGFKGVCFNKRRGKWLAYITVRNRRLYLGCAYDNPRKAAQAYNRAAIEHFDEFAVLNPV